MVPHFSKKGAFFLIKQKINAPLLTKDKEPHELRFFGNVSLPLK